MPSGDKSWPYARTIGAICIAGAAAGAAHAAAIKPSPQPRDIPGVTIINVSRTVIERPAASFDSRFHFSQDSLVGNVLASAAWQAPLSETAKLHPAPRAPRYAATGSVINGAASMYNPGDPSDRDSGDMNLSSGERYDGKSWTAAIRTDLRWQFGGVRYGKNYVPGYALVEGDGKKLIVRINDVGPLRAGRIIDLNKRAMRFFDPTLKIGVIKNIRVTPVSGIAGRAIALGPVVDPPATFASRFDSAWR